MIFKKNLNKQLELLSANHIPAFGYYDVSGLIHMYICSLCVKDIILHRNAEVVIL